MRLFVSAVRGLPLLSDSIPLRGCYYMWWPQPGEFYRRNGRPVPAGGRIIRVDDLLWRETRRVVVASVVQSRQSKEVGAQVSFEVVAIS